MVDEVLALLAEAFGHDPEDDAPVANGSKPLSLESTALITSPELSVDPTTAQTFPTAAAYAASA